MTRTPQNARKQLAAVRKRNAEWGAEISGGVEVSPSDRGRRLFDAAYDRRFLIALVDELATALRYQWLRTNGPNDVHTLLDELGLWR